VDGALRIPCDQRSADVPLKTLRPACSHSGICGLNPVRRR
jgi:hypothetical protein